MKQNIYDDEKFFNDYQTMRNQEVNANNLIEKPIFRSLLPSFEGKRVLDLGCGVGDLCKLAVDNGAKFTFGTDISNNMISEAKKFEKENLHFEKVAMEDLNQIDQKFDIVLSSLAFHYIEDFNKLISDIAGHLEKGGQLIFSQEHPVATAFVPAYQGLAKRTVINDKMYFLLSDYNNNGERYVNWNVEGVVKYHRNFTEIINALATNGFIIDKIVESDVGEDVIAKCPKYKYQHDRPYFLFVKATKR